MLTEILNKGRKYVSQQMRGQYQEADETIAGVGFDHSCDLHMSLYAADYQPAIAHISCSWTLKLTTLSHSQTTPAKPRTNLVRSGF